MDVYCFHFLLLCGLTGMLSKANGQVLRVAALMHLLFQGSDGDIGLCISQASINVAIDFVEVCCQHAAFIAGRETINEEIRQLTSGACVHDSFKGVLCLCS